MLFRTDQSGRAWPVNAPSGPQEPHGGRRKKKPVNRYDWWNESKKKRFLQTSLKALKYTAAHMEKVILKLHQRGTS